MNFFYDQLYNSIESGKTGIKVIFPSFYVSQWVLKIIHHTGQNFPSMSFPSSNALRTSVIMNSIGESPSWAFCRRRGRLGGGRRGCAQCRMFCWRLQKEQRRRPGIVPKLLLTFHPRPISRAKSSVAGLHQMKPLSSFPLSTRALDFVLLPGNVYFYIKFGQIFPVGRKFYGVLKEWGATKVRGKDLTVTIRLLSFRLAPIRPRFFRDSKRFYRCTSSANRHI